ncbi:hypothetical protein BB561_003320 [Smittium simulii]|uniref:60S ribosomal protein L34 n=1 Tax=Smittium simulii TaxID=133385 RepID=A0A2T9YLY2_9FUNG|nr:hypothetical protein BB561_003320 [Smittium simulii]
MVQRVTYRRRLSYNSRSNRVKIIKTPGARLRYLHIKKLAKGPRCGDSGAFLAGIPALRPFEYRRLSKCKKTVSRAYGGCLSGQSVRTRIVRAFLIEEQKIVKKVLKAQSTSK